MKEQQVISRWALAQQLQDLALRIAAGKPVRINHTSIRIPDSVLVQVEYENSDDDHEFEIEIKWPVNQIE